MFRVLCELHQQETPRLTTTHRLKDPHDLAAAEALRQGEVDEALHQLDLAGHLHVVEDEIHGYTEVLHRWWAAHLQGQDHPMVDRRNSVRLTLNRLAHLLLRATGEVGRDELHAANERRFSVGDRVVARTPARDLFPPGQPDAYVRNGAIGTVVELGRGRTAKEDVLTVDFDGIGRVDLPRAYFDEHEFAHGHRDVGLDHAYALTSYAVTGATHAVSTSRIDETSTRAETYVDITRGQRANHLYLVRADDPLDGETLPRAPAAPLDEAVTDQLSSSVGERTAWELREQMRQETSQRSAEAVGL